MGKSKPPKDILGLGRHLVRELGMTNGVDTLGRWMAHHVAELIEKAETAARPLERLRAQELVVDTILKIWERRESLPGNAYPLSTYKDAVAIINVLQPNANPFRVHFADADRSIDQLAAELFDNMSRLMMTLLLMKLGHLTKPKKVGQAAAKGLNATEQTVLRALQQWFDVIKLKPIKSKRPRSKKKLASGGKVDFEKAALALTETTSRTLTELSTSLRKSSEPEAGKKLGDARTEG